MRPTRLPYLLAALLMLAGCSALGTRGGPKASDGWISFVSERDGDSEIYLVRADGSEQKRLTRSPGDDREPAWSPDGSRIAFTSERDADEEIYVMAADGGQQVNLTNSPSTREYGATWSPDGTRIAYCSDGDLWVMNADGSGNVPLRQGPEWAFEPVWSPDGARIAFALSEDHGICVVNADGSYFAQLTDSPELEGDIAWSPDGSKIAFSSQREDAWGDIYVMNADGTEQRRLTGNGPDLDPEWSPDEKRLAYSASDGIRVVNADGTGQKLLRGTGGVRELARSLDGMRIAFNARRDGWGIYVVNADGSGLRRLTSSPELEWSPAWRPGPVGTER